MYSDTIRTASWVHIHSMSSLQSHIKSLFDWLLSRGGSENRRKDCSHILLFLLALTVAIAYMVSLFRFAESGFFSLNGGAAWLVIYGFCLKFLIGVRLLVMVHCGTRFDHDYDSLRKAFDVKKSDDLVAGSGGGSTGWNMQSIEITEKRDTNTENGDSNE